MGKGRVWCIEESVSNAVMGFLQGAEIMVQTRLGRMLVNKPWVEVDSLGFIWAGEMTSGLNEYISIALKAFLMVLAMNTQRKAHPQTPVKSLFPAFLLFFASKSLTSST